MARWSRHLSRAIVQFQILRELELSRTYYQMRESVDKGVGCSTIHSTQVSDNHRNALWLILLKSIDTHYGHLYKISVLIFRHIIESIQFLKDLTCRL